MLEDDEITIVDWWEPKLFWCIGTKDSEMWLEYLKIINVCMTM